MATVAQAVSAALDHHLAGRLEQAERLYGRILAAVPGHADANHLLGLLLAQTGRAEAGLVRVDAALAADSTAPAYHLTRGRILQALGRDEAAAHSLIAALTRQPDGEEAAALLAPLLRGLAERAFDAGQPVAAAALYRRALALAPDSLTAAFDLALCAMGEGRLPEAARAARAAGRLDPTVQRAGLLEAECWSALDRPAEAAAAARRAVLAGPVEATARLVRALALQRSGAGAAAAAAYRAFLALEPASAAGWGNLSIAQPSGMAAATITAARRAAAVLPDDAGQRVNLCAAQLAAEQPLAAVTTAQRGLALDPSSVELLLNLGSALSLRHAADAARPLLERALRLRPGDPAALSQLGQALESLGGSGAGPRLRRALAASPADAEGWAALGRVRLRNGAADEALRLARRALRLRPDTPAGLLLAGAAEEALGNEAAALAAYDRVIRRTPGVGAAFTRRSILLLRRAVGAAPPSRTATVGAGGRLMASRLGQDGRFGNQLLQYGTLRACAGRLGLELEVPDWIGRTLYGLDDPLPGPPLPVLLEGDLDVAAALDGRSDACAGRDVVGYFCGDTTALAPHRALFRRLFTPAGPVAARAEAALAALRDGGRTVVAIHLRRGDFGGDRFWIAPEAWYLDWLAALWPTLERPVLYLATDAPELASRFAAYHPVCADALGDPLPGAEFFLDHWLLSRADALAVSNSSFSVTAAMLNPQARLFVRPDRRLRRLVPFDPWGSPVLWE